MTAAETWQPPVIAVPEIADDHETRQRAARFIGAVALDTTTAMEQQESASAYSLMDAIHRAAEGNVDAYAMVRNNVATDVVERTIKSGHIIKVDLQVNEHGHIMQHGQTAEDIQKNSLRYAADSPFMRRRTEVETRNMFRIDEAYRQGLLKDFAFVVFSPAPDDTTTAEMAEAGFFTDTMSCAIQITTVEEDGGLSVESAFVAGKTAWDAPRHDLDTLGKVGAALEVDFEGRTAAEILDTPLLIHKSMLPNGVVDIVKLYDEHAGDTFFGEAKPQQDYMAYKQSCAEREKSFLPRVEKITRQLIAEAPTLTSPQAASRRLGKLSGAQMVEQSVVDTSIDPRVFGEAAAWRIEHARHMMAAGQTEGLHVIINQAKTLERSSSCPNGMKDNDALEGIDGVSEGDSQSTSSREELDDCEFVSKECPKCHKKDVKTVVKKGVYYGDCGCHS